MVDFQRVRELAENTPTAALCEAWDASPDYVRVLRHAPRQMTIQEAGRLAALHDLTLPDILAV